MSSVLATLALAGCVQAPRASERQVADGPAAQHASIGGRASLDDDAGTAFTSPDGEFRIALPDTPAASRTTDGRAVYQLRVDDYAYTVNELDCPTDFADDADPDALYDALQAASVRATAGTLQAQRDVTSAGEHVAGREFVVDAVTPRTGEAYEMVVRLFRVGSAVYLVQAIGPKTDRSRADRQAVVESFAVL